MSAKKGIDMEMPKRKGPGRPNLHPELDDRLMIRCSKTDKEEWTEHAIRLGFSGAGQWLRKLALEGIRKGAR